MPSASWRCALLAVIPAVCAAAAYTTKHTPRAMSHEPERPAIAFDQYMVDHGEIPHMEEVQTHFRMTNRSDQPIKLGELEVSCGCLKPLLTRQVLEPGQSGEVFVTVRTAAQAPGPQEYKIGVPYTDSRARKANLVFRMVLPEQSVFIRPRVVAFYQLDGKETSRDITVIDQREHPLNILKVESPFEFVTATLGEVDQTETGSRKTYIKLLVAGEIPPGRHRGNIVLTTDDPSYRVLKVGVMVEGRDAKVAAAPAAHHH